MHAKHVEPILDSLRHWFSRMEISTMRGGVAARDVSLFDLLEREKKIVPANCIQGINTWRARSRIYAHILLVYGRNLSRLIPIDIRDPILELARTRELEHNA